MNKTVQQQSKKNHQHCKNFHGKSTGASSSQRMSSNAITAIQQPIGKQPAKEYQD